MDYLKPNKDLYGLPWTFDEFNGMPYRLLGNSGLRVSNIGLGTWKIGYPETGDGSRVTEKTALKIFDKAVELGVTFWDTANRYNASSGNSERIIGKWFKENPDQRRNIILATKLFGSMDGKTPNHSRLSRLNILESVYASLERLQTDYIDLLYFHSYDSDTPPDESLAAVEDLIRGDMVRYFAVSNFTKDQLRMYKKLENVRTKVLAVQNQFDIINGENPKYSGVLDYCAKNNISFIAWSPLARGLLTEKYLEPSKVGPGFRIFDEGDWGKINKRRVFKILKELKSISSRLGLELNQLVLAYMLTIPGMGPVIPSASTVKQLESNAKAGKVKLSEKDILRIRKIVKI